MLGLENIKSEYNLNLFNKPVEATNNLHFKFDEIFKKTQQFVKILYSIICNIY